MSERMHAVVLHTRGIDGLILEERPVPQPAPGEALVRVAACGVGGTVLNKVNGLPDAQLPRVCGHEFAGEVVQVGAGVVDVALGDRVMAYYYTTCGRCGHCLAGQPARCTNGGLGDDRLGEHRDGGYAEYACVSVRTLLPVPEGLSLVDATVAADAVATPVHVCSRAGVGPGQRVLVIGAAGGIGIHLVQVAGVFGAEVVAVDRDAKLAAVGAHAPDADLQAADGAWPEALARRIDVAVDFIGSEETTRGALQTLDQGGRLVVLTTGPGLRTAASNSDLVARELSVLGSKYATYGDVMCAAGLLASGAVRPVISERGGLDSVAGQLARIAAGELVGRGVTEPAS